MDSQHDPFLQRLVPALAEVPGVETIALGGSRARGTASSTSDYDVGLYFSRAQELDTGRLLEVAKTLVDDPDAARVTAVGEWGPWIVGGAWLTVQGQKLDLLYRSVEAVADVIEACRAGEISMDYQAGHPHGFCSAIWMGEVALCLPLYDPRGTMAELKSRALLYPSALRDALIRRFQWEILFSIDNGELAASREEQTQVAGCVHRALACIAQVLFALNERYLINEKGALQEAAQFPLVIPDLTERVARIWQLVGNKSFRHALAVLRSMEREVKALTEASADPA